MDFRPLQLGDKDAIARVLVPLRRNDSTLGFANLFSLQEKYGTEVCLEDGVLYARQELRLPDATAYFVPLGAADVAAAVDFLLDRAHAAGERPCLVNVASHEKRALEDAAPGRFAFAADRDFADYLYRTDVIAAYSGPGLAKKRRETNKFFSLYGERAAFEPIAARGEVLAELEAFQQRWFEASRRRGTDEHPLELEHRKILLDLRHFAQLDLEGIALRIDGRVEGYAYGSMLPGGAFDVMVLKGNLDFRFVWRALLRELARSVSGRAQLLNLEEDLGLPGLRENKMSYQPCDLLEKYRATPCEPKNPVSHRPS